MLKQCGFTALFNCVIAFLSGFKLCLLTLIPIIYSRKIAYYSRYTISVAATTMWTLTALLYVMFYFIHFRYLNIVSLVGVSPRQVSRTLPRSFNSTNDGVAITSYSKASDRPSAVFTSCCSIGIIPSSSFANALASGHFVQESCVYSFRIILYIVYF